MHSSGAIFCGFVLWISLRFGVHCNTITLQPNTDAPVPGISYSWLIPPQSQEPPQRPSDFDHRKESSITPIGGFGHPLFNLRHSHEQLTLPNEFLITPADPPKDGLSSAPLFRQFDLLLMNQADCDGRPTCPNVDITQQQHPSPLQQINIDLVSAITPPDQHQLGAEAAGASAPPGQPVSWPSSHGGGIGLLFFVPDSASHLPVEQLIRQQLDLHRTQFPFDISINCEDDIGSGHFSDVGRPANSPAPPFANPPSRRRPTTLNGWNVENVNYATLPLVDIVNSSSRREAHQHQHQHQQQPQWRTISERIVRNKQHQNRLQQQQQREQQLQQNQRELSILP